MPKPESSVLNVRNMCTMITNAFPGSSVLNVRDMDIIIINAFWRVDMLILYLVMMIRKFLKYVFLEIHASLYPIFRS